MFLFLSVFDFWVFFVFFFGSLYNFLRKQTKIVCSFFFEVKKKIVRAQGSFEVEKKLQQNEYS